MHITQVEFHYCNVAEGREVFHIIDITSGA